MLVSAPTPLSGTTISGSAGLQVESTGIQNFPSESLGVIVRGTIPFPLDYWYTWSLAKGEKI